MEFKKVRKSLHWIHRVPVPCIILLNRNHSNCIHFIANASEIEIDGTKVRKENIFCLFQRNAARLTMIDSLLTLKLTFYRKSGNLNLYPNRKSKLYKIKLMSCHPWVLHSFHSWKFLFISLIDGISFISSTLCLDYQ